MKQLLLTFITIVTIHMGATAQDAVIGKWKTIDDNTGEAKSVVEIYKQNGKVYGKIVKLFRGPDEEQDPICEECPGDRKNKKIIGLTIITDMEWDADDNEYDDGEILDPQDGKVYDCKLWYDDEEGKLKVRGYLAFFYRTQTWVKAD